MATIEHSGPGQRATTVMSGASGPTGSVRKWTPGAPVESAPADGGPMDGALGRPDRSSSPWIGPVAVTVAALGFGLSPYFATQAFESGINPVAASFIRVAMLAVVLSPFARGLRGWARQAVVVACGGAISMFGFAGFFIALDRAPVAAATVVYYTYPVAVLVLSAVVWRRRLALWEVAVCASVLAGVVLAVGPIDMSGAMLLALAPAVAAPIGWAIYLMILSGPAGAMPTLPKVFAGACGGAAALFPFALWSSGGSLMPVTSAAITSMGLLTLCTLAIPAVLVTWGAARAGERATAMIGSLEFVVAVGAGWLLLGDDLSAVQLCGVGVILAAVACAARRQVAPTGSTSAPSPVSTEAGAACGVDDA